MDINNIQPESFFKRNFPQILGVVIIIFAILVYFSIKGISLNDNTSQTLKKVVTVSKTHEGFTKQLTTTQRRQNKNKKNKKNIKKKPAVTPTVVPAVVPVPNKTDSTLGFCGSTKYTPSEINEKCGQLSKDTCNVTGCCVYLNGSKCVSGDKNGPTFLSDGKGSLLNIDYYYYKDKCYGNCKNK